MTQSIIIQVGQCGNQIGCRFWDLALQEHASYNKKGHFDEPLSSFFRNVDSRFEDPIEIPVGDGSGKIRSLKARAILVDMEEGVINSLLKGPLREIFDRKQLITDVSGSGNNWAVGHMFYGTNYSSELLDAIRKEAERCDCLQCFFILHSMGGGTGSGIGTRMLQLLADEFPDVHRFITAVFPSSEDDVITSPYNSILALKQLTDYADCVLPVENQALLDICNRITKAVKGEMVQKYKSGNSIKEESALINTHGATGDKKRATHFHHMNNIVANLLLNMTSSARFEGSLNVDLNEITMNLVPFSKLHYLFSSMAPLYNINDVNLPPRRLDEIFTDTFSPSHQLIRGNPKHGLYMACALMVRGKVHLSDIRRNVDRLKPTLKFIHWNPEGWKTGLCSVQPIGQPYSLLTLANNTFIHNTFSELLVRFNRLYKRKAHIHHYTSVEGMNIAEFDNSVESVTDLICEYQALEQQGTHSISHVPRLTVKS